MKLGGIIIYNSFKSNLWFRLRSNTLNLEERKRYKKEDTKCKLCFEEEENISHFVMKCPNLQAIRIECIELQWPLNENIEELLGQFIFDNQDINKKMNLIEKMWKRRRQLMGE